MCQPVTYARQHVVTLLFQPQGSFAVAGPSTWNSLPAPPRSCQQRSVVI